MQAKYRILECAYKSGTKKYFLEVEKTTFGVRLWSLVEYFDSYEKALKYYNDNCLITEEKIYEL